MKAFIYLLPEDPYFASIISHCINQLSQCYPQSIHVVIPVFAIKFCYSGNTAPSRLKNFFRYCFSQATLSFRLKKMLELQLDISSRRNIRYLNVVHWLLAKPWRGVVAHDFTDSQDFVERYEIDGLHLGDLVCDTYLRFKPSPVFDFTNFFTFSLIHLSKHYIQFFNSVFNRYKATCVFGSFTGYIYHGIPHRIAASKGIRTISFGCLQRFARVNMPGETPSQVAPYHSYLFSGINQYSEKLIELATSSLINRIEGSYDLTVPYMHPWGKLRLQKNQSVSGSIVIFLHDFFDAPHIYSWILFPDFYTWITHTIDYCIAQKILLYIKPHPCQSNDSKSVVADLIVKYNGFDCVNWIESNIPNSNIFAAKPKLIVTVYGSVAPEACFAGIPVLLAGDNPAINFPIAKIAWSREEYFDALMNPSSVLLGDPEAAIAFLIQHNLSTYQKEDESLVSFLGCSFNYVAAHPDILRTPSVRIFLNNSVSKLISDL